jgi:hypothetical protein
MNNRRKAQALALFFEHCLKEAGASCDEIEDLSWKVSMQASTDKFFDGVSVDEDDALMLQWVQEHCIELLNKALEE